MEQKKYVEDYTLKELYANFSDLKMIDGARNDEFDNGRLFQGKSENDLYLRLKFTKFLNQYKTALDSDSMPTSLHKYSEAIIDRIFASIDTISTGDIEGNVKYDPETRKIIFNKSSYENEISNDMMYELTNIALKDMRPTKEENTELKQINKARIEYISAKLLKIKNREKYDSTIGEDTPRLQVYNTLVKKYGEDTMLTLNSSNISKIKAADFSYVNKMLESYYEKDATPATKATVYKDIKELPSLIDKALLMVKEDEKEPTEIAKRESNDLNLLLLQGEDIFSKEEIEQMNINMYRGLKDIKKAETQRQASASYFARKKLIEIYKQNANKNKDRRLMSHEVFHAATTIRDEVGMPIRAGFCYLENCNMGVAITEGATEYFVQELYKKSGRKPIEYCYLELVNMTKDLVNLYGKKEFADAMINDPKKLEELMKKDGKCYTEFMEITDDYYRTVYQKDKPWHEIMKTSEEAKEKYLRIGKFIDEIKASRGIENLTEQQKTSEWEKSMELFEEKQNWFKTMISKIKERFSKKEKTLLLEEGNLREGELAINSQEEFKNSLKVEISKSEYEHLIEHHENKDNIRNNMNNERNQNQR